MSDSSDEPGTLAQPLAPLAAALRVLLLVLAVLSAGLAYLAVRMRTALDEADRVGPSAVADADDAVAAFFNGTSVFFVTMIGVGGLFVFWMWRAAKNNEAFGRPGALSPGWAIGAWFIPFGSLVIPAIQLQQLWRGADASVPRGDPAWRRSPHSAQLWVWWVSYVLGQGLTVGGFTLLGDTSDPDGELSAAALLTHLDDVRLGVTLFVAGQALLVLAAPLGAALVIRLTRRQESTATVIGSEAPSILGWARPASPPAWHPDPIGRFDLRWWDGRLWTQHVTRAGEQTEDPEPL